MWMSKLRFLLTTLFIGILNAVILVIFEFITTQGTEYLWNDFFNTDANRFSAIPVAILLSIIFSATIILFKQKRIGNPETDLLSDESIKPTSINDLIAIFVIGAISLLAGASLGPEASLVGIATGIGILFAEKIKNMEGAKLLALSSVGALLVAFLGSLFPVLIPILLIYKKEKKIVPAHLIPPIIAGIASYITLNLIKGNGAGYEIPLGNTYTPPDLISAIFLGFLGAFVAAFIKLLINKFEILNESISSKTHWIVSAAIFGGVLGTIYLLGGQTIEFSGREGTNLLLQTQSSYSAIALITIAVAKLLVTSWSLPSGYRGGLIFPSIFMAVALSLALETFHPVLGGPGVIVGGVSGILTAMASPVLGFILILSIIPFNFVGIAAAGLIGALIGTKLIYKIDSSKSKSA